MGRGGNGRRKGSEVLSAKRLQEKLSNASAVRCRSANSPRRSKLSSPNASLRLLGSRRLRRLAVRIKSLSLMWFRGAADSVALEPAGKSMVVYGENGAGKSSFIDGLEYVINDGKLRHLSHEYAGRNQEKAIINTQIPDECVTALKLTFVDNTEIDIRIGRNGTQTRTGGEAINMTSWDYRTTVLRQDEVAEFIRSRKGEKYSAILPLLGLESLRVRCGKPATGEPTGGAASGVAGATADCCADRIEKDGDVRDG